MPITRNNIGDSFEDFLDDQGLLEESTEVAIKRVLAYQIQQLMEKQNISKTVMAKKMRTSRSSLDRLLDPQNNSVTLQTLQKAADVLGRKVRLQLV